MVGIRKIPGRCGICIFSVYYLPFPVEPPKNYISEIWKKDKPLMPVGTQKGIRPKSCDFDFIWRMDWYLALRIVLKKTGKLLSFVEYGQLRNHKLLIETALHLND